MCFTYFFVVFVLMAPQNSTFLSDDDSLPSEISRLSPIPKRMSDEFGGSSCQVNDEPYYEVGVTISNNLMLDISKFSTNFKYVFKSFFQKFIERPNTTKLYLH